MCSDLHVCLAEGEGLEPPSPFGQRFSSPFTILSVSYGNRPTNPIPAGQKGGRDLLELPVTPVCFRASDGLKTACLSRGRDLVPAISQTGTPRTVQPGRRRVLAPFPAEEREQVAVEVDGRELAGAEVGHAHTTS